MQWLVLVIFMQPSDGFYVFTTPSFETKDECMASVTDPQQIPQYVEKIWEDYGGPVRVKGVTCITKDDLQEIILPKPGLEA